MRMSKENPSWGYDRIVGAIANIGHRVSDETVGNILRKHGIAPAPKRSRTMSWRDFLASHMNVMAGADFFTVEVLTWRGLVTYYVLFFLHLESRRVQIAGMTRHPDQEWMQQMARNATLDGWGALANCRYVLHDRDSKFCAAFGPGPLWVLKEYSTHYHTERNHQGKGNLLLFPRIANHRSTRSGHAVLCKHRLGGLLKFYERAA